MCITNKIYYRSLLRIVYRQMADTLDCYLRSESSIWSQQSCSLLGLADPCITQQLYGLIILNICGITVILIAELKSELHLPLLMPNSFGIWLCGPYENRMNNQDSKYNRAYVTVSQVASLALQISASNLIYLGTFYGNHESDNINVCIVETKL